MLFEIIKKLEFIIDIEIWNFIRIFNVIVKDDVGIMYKKIRKMIDDVDKIVDNFEILKNIFNVVKNYVFEEEYYIVVGLE